MLLDPMSRSAFVYAYLSSRYVACRHVCVCVYVNEERAKCKSCTCVAARCVKLIMMPCWGRHQGLIQSWPSIPNISHTAHQLSSQLGSYHQHLRLKGTMSQKGVPRLDRPLGTSRQLLCSWLHAGASNKVRHNRSNSVLYSSWCKHKPVWSVQHTWPGVAVIKCCV